MFVVLCSLIFLLAGCTAPEKTLYEEVEENIKYEYTVEKDYNMASCYFTVDSYDDFYFDIYSTNNETISFGIINLEKMDMQFDKENPELMRVDNAEIAYNDEDAIGYFGTVPLVRGEYWIMATDLYAENISVVIRSSKELDCP